MIFWHLKVKFRFLRFDVGTVRHKGGHPVLPVPIPSFDQVVLNDRGIYLRLATFPLEDLTK